MGHIHLGGGNAIPVRNKGTSSCNSLINPIKNHQKLKILEMEKWKSPNKKLTNQMGMSNKESYKEMDKKLFRPNWFR